MSKPPSTKQATLWVTGGHVLTQVIRLASNLIFTRMLAPEMFGIIAAANLLIIGLHQFSDVGIMQSVVRAKDAEDRSFLNTIWAVQFARGVLISVILALLGLFFFFYGHNFGDTVYGSPLLAIVILLLTVHPLINGLLSPGYYVQQRNMNYRVTVLLEVGSQVAGFLLGLIYVYTIKADIYALVIMQICAISCRVIGSHLFFNYRCAIHVNFEHVKDIMSFGSWVLLSSLIGFLFASGDRILIGANSSITLFGIFSIASFIAVAIKEVVGKLIGSVFLSAIGRVAREDEESLPAYYYSLRLKADSVLFFLAGLVFMSGQEVISFLYDDRYAQAGRMLQILSFSIIGSGLLLCSQLLMAKGKSKLASNMILIQTIGFYIVVSIAVFGFDIWVGIWAISLFSIAQFLLSTIYEYRELGRMPLKRALCIPFLFAGGVVGYVISLALQLMNSAITSFMS